MALDDVTARFAVVEAEIAGHLSASRDHRRASKVSAIAFVLLAIVALVLASRGLWPPRAELREDSASAIDAG